MARSDFEQMMNHAPGPDGPCRCRMCSSRPSLQNVPIGPARLPHPEVAVVDVDYAAAEKRVLKRHLAGDMTHDLVDHGVDLDAYRNASGRRVVTLSVDGTTYFRVELPEGAHLRLGSGHEMIDNVFERDGKG